MKPYEILELSPKSDIQTVERRFMHLCSILQENENLKELTPHPGILPHALEQFLPSKKVVKKNRIVGPSMEIPAEKYRKLTKNVHRSVLDQAFCEKYPDRCVNGRMRL